MADFIPGVTSSEITCTFQYKLFLIWYPLPLIFSDPPPLFFLLISCHRLHPLRIPVLKPNLQGDGIRSSRWDYAAAWSDPRLETSG